MSRDSVGQNMKDLISRERDKQSDSKLMRSVESQYIKDQTQTVKEDDYEDDFEKKEEEDQKILSFFEKDIKDREIQQEKQRQSQVKASSRTRMSKGKNSTFSGGNDQERKKYMEQKKLDYHLKKFQEDSSRVDRDIASTKRYGKFNRDDDFDKYKYKAEMDRLKDENKKLSQKNKLLIEQLKPQDQRKAYKAIGPDSRSGITREQQKIKDLLKMIEIQKQQIRSQEATNKNLQKMLNSNINVVPNEVHEKNVKLVGIQAQFREQQKQIEVQKKEIEHYRQKIMELNTANKDQRDQIIDLQEDNRMKDLSLRNAEEYKEDLANMKKEKERMEEQYKKLSTAPVFSEFADSVKKRSEYERLEQLVAEQESKNKQLLSEKDDTKTSYNILDKDHEELKIKYQKAQETIKEQEVKLNMVDKQMAPFRELQKMDTSLYEQALGAAYAKNNKLGWQQYVDPDSQQSYADQNQIDILQSQLQKATYEKGELALRLDDIKNQFKCNQEMLQSRCNLLEKELEQKKYQLNAAEKRAQELAMLADRRARQRQIGGADDQEGPIAKRDDDDMYFGHSNVFSTADDQTVIKDELHSTNYFDLWIGAVDIFDINLEYATRGRLRASDGDNLKTFITVDFYDHNTQNTRIESGLMPDFDFQMNYKVDQSEFFFDYIDEGFFRIELYATYSTDAILLGAAEVSLKKLYQENTKEFSSYIEKEQVHLYALDNRNKDIASVNIKMRLRFSPFKQIELLNEKKEHKRLDRVLQEQREQFEQKKVHVSQDERSLMIVVGQAIDLPVGKTPFVYYNFKGEDINSHAVKETNPEWNLHTEHKIVYDDQFVKFLKNDTLTFTIFDDSVGIYDENDVIGQAEFRMNQLLETDIVQSEIPIYRQLQRERTNRQMAGKLFIKMFWKDEAIKLQRQPVGYKSNLNDNIQQDITLRIAKAVVMKRLNIRQAFLVFDRDQDSIINIDDFKFTVEETLNLKMMNEEIEFYFKRMPQPVGEENFRQHFNTWILSEAENNEMLRANHSDFGYDARFKNPVFTSQQARNIAISVDKIIEIELKRNKKDIMDIFNEIDSSSEGYVDVYELKGWLLQHDIQENDDVLSEFFKAVDRNHDNKINLLEFFEFVLEKRRPEELQKLKNHSYSRGTQFLQDIGDSKKKILDYMAQNKLTFIEMHELIDKDKNKRISRQEMSAFFLDKFSEILGQKRVVALVDAFDTNKDGHVDFSEFVNEMQRSVREMPNKDYYYSLFRGSKVELTRATNQIILSGIASYLTREGQPINELFLSLDQNQNNRLNKSEMRDLILKKLNINLEDKEFDEFFESLDEDRDGQISIMEWIQTLQPEVERFKKEQRRSQVRGSVIQQQAIHSKHVSSEQLNIYKEKMLDFVKKKGEELLNSFERQQISEGQIGATSFRNILNDKTVPLTNDELDAYIAAEVTKDVSGDNISYLSWLSKVNPKMMKAYKMKNEQLEQSTRLAKEVFTKIIRTAKSKNMNISDVYKRFDKDKDENLSKEEFANALKKMFTLNEQEIEQIIAIVDDDNDGIIRLHEFQQMVNYCEAH